MMVSALDLSGRKTTADLVFDHLREEILSLKMLPGTKITEAEIANQMGVSRQPVRDAFTRLGSLGFVQIRPQKATVVKKFSIPEIERVRFLRLAIEVEIVRLAVLQWDPKFKTQFDKTIDLQKNAADIDDIDTFHVHDMTFHQLLCEVAGRDFAIDDIRTNKAQIDRLCVLSLLDKSNMAEIIDEHERILACVESGDAIAAEAAIRKHLFRLDSTIEIVQNVHPDFFE